MVVSIKENPAGFCDGIDVAHAQNNKLIEVSSTQ
jgi:hypothetical protein